MEKGKKLIKNSIIVLIGVALTKCLNFIMAPLFTRWLPAEEYGMFDLIVMFSTFLIPVIAVGIHHGLFRYLLDVNTKDKITTINSNAIFINIIGFIIYLFIVLPLFAFLHKTRHFIVLLTIMFIFQSIYNYLGMFVRGIKKLKIYSISNIICAFSTLFFTYIFLKKGGLGLNGIVLGYSSGYACSSLFILLFTNYIQYFNLKYIDKAQIKTMIKYSLPMIPNSIAWWIVNLSDRMIVNIFLGPLYNAILAVAHKLPNLCVTLYEGFQTAWIENASESIKDKNWNNYLNKTINLLSQFSISVSIMIISTNFFVFEFLFTNEYILGKSLVPLFSIAIIFNTLSQTIGSVFIAEYNSKEQATTMLEAGIINIIVHLLLIKIIGIYASVVSTIIAYLFLFFIRYKRINKKYKIIFDNKTIIMFVFLFIFVLFSYLDFGILNYIFFVLSLFLCVFCNFYIIKVILNKLRNIAKQVTKT